MTSSISPPWGLRHDITPCFGARLAGEETAALPGRQAGLYGTFAPEQLRALDRSFPAFIRQMEAALRSGELDPHNSHSIG
jgi:cytoskeleton bundling-enhancing protein CbeA-like protein